MCHFTIEYQNCMLVLACIYLILGMELEIFKKEEVVNEFSHSSLYLLNEYCPFNEVFSEFLQVKIRIELPEMLPFVQYVSKFCGLTMEYTLPKACQNEEADDVRIFIPNFKSNFCIGPI